MLEDYLKSNTTLLILNIISNKDSYAYEINLILEKISGGYIINEGILYTSLKKLEKSELVSSYWNSENSKKRKYYQITTVGEEHLKELNSSFEKGTDLINKIIGGDYEH